MGKIYLYELRRTVRSKFFWGLLAVCLFFGWNTLKTATIRGAAHTAPFSPWSFGAYLARLLPLLGVALLFSNGTSAMKNPDGSGSSRIPLPCLPDGIFW